MKKYNLEKRSRENIEDAIEGRYDEKLVEVVAREADVVESSPSLTEGMTLESYLLKSSPTSSSSVSEY